jgi:hypothetical protein
MVDFDRVIERRGTHASKWDNIARLSGIESPDAGHGFRRAHRSDVGAYG